MILVLAVAYRLTALGVAHDIPQYDEDNIRRKPTTISLAQNGNVAVIAATTQNLVVIRRDGTRVSLRVPASANSGYFRDVALADDGTPFATIASNLDGAFMGTSESILRWNGAWRSTIPPFESARIASASSLRTFVANSTNDAAFGNAEPAISHDLEDQVMRVADATKRTPVYGDALAARGTYVVGTAPGHHLVRPPEDVPPRAMIWPASGEPIDAGPGIARGVNVHGVAVGDDEPTFDSTVAYPTRWDNGTAQRLDPRAGVAYDIADDGTIVGRFESEGAFVIRPHHAPELLDALLTNRDWHVLSAYQISARGRILAYARRGRDRTRIVVLDPVRSRASTSSACHEISARPLRRVSL